MTLNEELERCDREIEAMQGQESSPAWLVALGVNDWEVEKRFLLRESILESRLR